MEEVTMKMSFDNALCVYAELTLSLKQYRKAIDPYLRTVGKVPDWLHKNIAELERVLEIIEKSINEK